MFEEKDYSWRDPNKGYTPVTNVAANMAGDYMYDTGLEEPIPFLVRLYLSRIVQLCKGTWQRIAVHYGAGQIQLEPGAAQRRAGLCG